MWRQHLMIAAGIVIAMPGLAFTAMLSFGFAEKLLWAWSIGLSLGTEWANEQTRLAVIAFLGLMLSGAGAFIVRLAIRDVRARGGCRTGRARLLPSRMAD